MGKKNNDVGQSAWIVLRLAFLWARKGGVFKRRLIMELRLVPKFLKGLGHTATRHTLNYKERELSFDETPIFHVKMHRPTSMRFLLPCISPQDVGFDYDFGLDEYDGEKSSPTCFLVSEAAEEEEGGEGKDCGCEGCDEKSLCAMEVKEGIDSKAEKFIAKFYEQIKL